MQIRAGGRGWVFSIEKVQEGAIVRDRLLCDVMPEVTPSTSRGEDAVELVGEASCSAADGSTCVPPSIAAESPSFLTWMWFQILTACSGVWGARGGKLSRPRVLGIAPGAQQTTQEESESEVLSRIASSKLTWSEVPDIHRSVPVLRSGELSAWAELKESAPDFFRDDWADKLEIGRLIAEGGQAQIFEAKLREGDDDVGVVVKVFKLDAGFTLADLKRHWPLSMGEEDCTEFLSRRSTFIFYYPSANFGGYRCGIGGATLLKNGSFAFVLIRYWGDLRTLIDLRVKENNRRRELSENCTQHPPFSLDESITPFSLDESITPFSLDESITPFSMDNSIWIMKQIAEGMGGLHAEGVLHRDLKATNVLVRKETIDSFSCHVADYECAMFVQGTGFWRAPEVLQELQKRKEDQSSEIWTKKVDVYSFGMTCYEILTGQIPFDGYTKRKWNDVIKGERPLWPKYRDDKLRKLRELVEACWHVDPLERPSFEVIIDELETLHLQP